MRPERHVADDGDPRAPHLAEAPGASFAAFLARHDALSQQRVAVVAHAVRVPAFTVFGHHRVALRAAWSTLAGVEEPERITASSLALVRRASALAAGDGPGSVTVPRDVLASAQRLDPAWRSPDPWTLLAPRAMRALRALVHLDATARDDALRQWLGVDPAAAAADLGLPTGEYRRRRDEAMAFWAHVVREADG